MTKIPNYCEVHNHIGSFDAGSTPEIFARRESELETGCLTVTDHGTMTACMDTYRLAQKNKLVPIMGLEAYMRDDNCPILTAAGIPKDDKGTFRDYSKYNHLLIHARDQKAFEFLGLKLSHADERSEQHGSEKKPIFGWNDLEEIGGHNVTMSSGCLVGVVGRHFLAGRLDIAMKHYEKIRALVGSKNFVVELFPHVCATKWVEGVFITLEDGVERKYWKGKVVRVERNGESMDVSVEELARRMGGKDTSGFKLVAIKNRQKWDDIEGGPVAIKSTKSVQDFLPNECNPDYWPDGDVQLGMNKFLYALAHRYGDRIYVSGDAHYAYPEEYIVQDIKLRNNGGGGLRFTSGYHRQTSQEAYDYFRGRMGISESEFESWVDHSREWVEGFRDFKLDSPISLPTKFFPDDTTRHLKTLIDKHGRMHWDDPKWMQRLQQEVTLLRDNGSLDLLPYFFMGEDFMDFYAGLRKLPGPGRGSAAGVLISYLLNITQYDPISNELSLDRFLTLDRIVSGAMPDIDMDFPDREPLLDPEKGYLWKRYGDHASAISTDTLIRLKSSLKDVTRALKGYVTPEVEALAKGLGNPPQGIEDRDWIFGYKSDDGVEHEGLLQTSKELQDYAEHNAKDWEIVCKCLRCVRARSRHASGFVIANRPVAEFLPTMTISGVRTTQYTAASVEARGGLKVDLLGVNSLADISDAINLIQLSQGGLRTEGIVINGEKVPGHRILNHEGRDYDIWKLPEDQAVYRDICEGKTETVFQFNTPAAKGGLEEFNYWKDEAAGKKLLSSLLDLTAFTSLDRPGPLDAYVVRPDGGKHNMLVEFARRARGMPAVEPIDVFYKIMPETLGVLTYQESLQKLYQHLTDCTGPEAEEFRRNIAKKKMDKVNKAYSGFIAAATPKIGEEQAKNVWGKICTFGQYGFNKSHALCYAAIGYTCAFLKHHYKLIWWCSVLRNATKKEITEKFYPHCKQWLRPPSVQYSEEKFAVVGNEILAPISYINGVGPKAHDELVAGRPYTDVDDFCRKIIATKKLRIVKNEKTGKWKMGTSALNSSICRKLIIAGVFDSFFAPDEDLASKMEAFYEAYARAATEVHIAIAALTGAKPTTKRPEKVTNQIKNLTAINRYQIHKELMPIGSSKNLIESVAHVHGVVEDITKSSTHKYVPTDIAVLKELRRQTMAPQFMPGGHNELPMRFVGAELLGKIIESTNEVGPFRLCVAAYVAVDGNILNKNNGSTARKFTLDIEGLQLEVVKWPRRDEKKVTEIPEALTGAVVIAVLYKHSANHEFKLDALVIVEKPVKLLAKDGKADDPESQSESEEDDGPIEAGDSNGDDVAGRVGPENAA